MNVEKIVYPDYSRSIINITASILRYFGCDSQYLALEELSKEYLDKFENILFLVIDGLGSQVIKEHLDADSFFRKNCVSTLTSVFPPTTAAAISSYLSGLSPLEHGIIGWTLYFKEYFKLVDFLPLSDATTGEHIGDKYRDIHEKFHFESIFKMINDARPEVEQHYVCPQSLTKSKYTKMASSAAEIFSYTDFDNALHYIENTVKENNKKKLFYCYTGEPDKTMHAIGVNNDDITTLIRNIQSKVQELHEKLSGTNSLIIVTADHGMIDVDESIIANDESDLWDSLVIPTFPEARFISCFIKRENENKFLEYIKNYEADFLILNKEEFLAKGLLGRGQVHPRLLDMLGDYILIAKNNKAIQTSYQNKFFKFRAMHAGVTEKEMLVPLILLD